MAILMRFCPDGLRGNFISQIWLLPVLFLTVSWLWQTDKKTAIIRNVRALLRIVMISVAILLPIQYLMYRCSPA